MSLEEKIRALVRECEWREKHTSRDEWGEGNAAAYETVGLLLEKILDGGDPAPWYHHQKEEEEEIMEPTKTNYELAVDVIEFQGLDPDYAENIADELKFVGLLAPDLPALDTQVATARSSGYAEWRDGKTVVWTVPGGRVMIQNIEPGDLIPNKTRALAYALLAAADYAEDKGAEE